MARPGEIGFRRMVLTVFLALILVISVTACSSTTQYAREAPNDPGQHAKIIFTRKWAMLGAAVTHYVVDRGKGADFDAVIVERREFTQLGGDISKVRNVLLVARYDEEENLVRVAGSLPPCERWLVVDENAVVSNYGPVPLRSVVCAPPGMTMPSTVEIQDEVIFERVGDRLVAKYQRSELGTRVANGQLLGGVRAGGELTWYRREGWVRLQVASEGGDQADAPMFFAQAGRTYRVDWRISTLSISGDFVTVEDGHK